jgi:hypothetical protein
VSALEEWCARGSQCVFCERGGDLQNIWKLLLILSFTLIVVLGCMSMSILTDVGKSLSNSQVRVRQEGTVRYGVLRTSESFCQ